MRKKLVSSGLVIAALGAAGLGGCAGQQAGETAPPDSDVTVTRTPHDAGSDQSDVASLEAALAQMDQQRQHEAGGGGGKGAATQAANQKADVDAAVEASHADSPGAIHMKGVPAIGEGDGAASQPAAAMGEMKTEPEAVTPAANQPATQPQVATASVASSDMSVDIALAVLRKHVAEHPTLGTRLAMGLLDAADGKTPDTSAAGLADSDQKLLVDLLAGVQAITGSSATSLGERAQPLVALVGKWETQVDLSLPKIALASRVDSFGVFTAVDAKFSQGQKHTVIIYCEVANFASKKTDDGWYETDLAQQETLVTDDKLLVWRPNPEEVVDKSMNQRHDFYLVKKLTIPDNLAVGNYTLQMSVTDHNSGKAAIKSIPLEITDK